MKIILPLPHKALSPNGRPNRWVKAKHVKSAKRTANILATQQLLATANSKARLYPDGPLSLTATFYFRDKRSFADDDNLIGSLKAYRDGIADALTGGDDKSMSWAGVRQLVARNDPRVEIDILPSDHPRVRPPKKGMILS